MRYSLAQGGSLLRAQPGYCLVAHHQAILMKPGRSHFLAAILILGLVLPSPFQAEIKTIQRVDDPVVMESRVLTALLKSPLDRLALMVRTGEVWAPIPFQIDEKKPDGSYAFTLGPLAGPDPDPTLDANDELVFMVKDTGDRVEDQKWPEAAEAVMEIEVSDPKNGQKGWAYLVRFSGPAPRSQDDYIRVETDQARNYRKVITYEYVMGGPLNVLYPDHMSARELPNGRPGVDVLDRLKMRGEFVLPLGLSIPLIMDEMTKSKDKGLIDGPVRVLSLAEGYLELAKHIKIKGEGYSLITYYVNHMIWPMVMELPMARLLKIENFHGYLDFNQNVFGSCNFSAANPYHEGVVFDGRMGEAEKKLDTETNIDWNAGFGPQGAIIHRLYFEPRQAVSKQLHYFIDDATMKDPPEDFPGVFGAGYHLVFPEELLPQSTVYQYYYFLSRLRPEEVSRILDILDHPVEVRVKARVGP